MEKIARLKRYFALSRTPHGLLDMATPCMAVLLFLGRFPSLDIALIGCMTAFAGYTAIYAFNDVIDYHSDRKKCRVIPPESGNYLDSLIMRHPMAQDLLSYKEGISWAVGWSVVAVCGAFLLNPICVAFFLSGAALEAIYCSLWRVSPFRAIVSGIVKNMGAIAALFAVDAQPSLAFIGLLFAALFFWEIGGQNIPADWTDLDEDRVFGARTIPVTLGERKAGVLACGTLLLGVFFTMVLFGWWLPVDRWISLSAVLVIAVVLLLAPVIKLLRTNARADAMVLFNKASYYPAALLGLVLLLI